MGYAFSERYVPNPTEARVNDTVQDWINGMAGHSAFLDLVMKISADDIVFALPLFLLALWFWPAGDRALRQRIAVATCLAVALSLLASTLLGHLLHEARPFVSDPSTRQLIGHSADNSFPSEHAAIAFAVAGVAIWWRRTLGGVCLALAVLVGFARVYVGVHWPLDIVASAGMSLLVGAVLAAGLPLLIGPQRRLSRLLPRSLIAEP